MMREAFTPTLSLSAEKAFARRATYHATQICLRAPRVALYTKRDLTPVCAADIAIQATVEHLLHEHFPDDELLAEEDVGRVDEVGDLLPPFGRASSPRAPHARTRGGRTWVLDPIDGTKGFVSGAGYAVGLALLEDDAPRLGALALPRAGRLLLGDARGSLDDVALGAAAATAGRTPRADKWLLSGGALRLAGRARAQPLCCGSLVKYAAVATGDAAFFVQTGARGARAWDHAAGIAVVRAGGGRVSDEGGGAVRVAEGRVSMAGRAIVASGRGVAHEEVCVEVRGGLAQGEAMACS